jgi:hypothetical protein
MTNQLLRQDIEALLEYANTDVLKYIHTFLEKSAAQSNNHSPLTKAQEEEIERRIADLESGRGVNYTEEEALAIIQKARGK